MIVYVSYLKLPACQIHVIQTNPLMGSTSFCEFALSHLVALVFILHIMSVA